MLGKRINNWRVYKGGTPFQQYARMKLIERKVDKKLQSGFKGYAIVDQFGNLLHDTISEYGRKSVVLFLEKYDTTQDWHAISLKQDEESRELIRDRWNNIYVKQGYFSANVEIKAIKTKRVIRGKM